jgi:gentisate 1,2-dioxygenase
MLTEKNQTGFRKKNARLRVEEKKRKKRCTPNTVLTPTHRQKPAHKSPTAAGMRKYKRSMKAKKTVLRLNERNKINKKQIRYINTECK